MKKIVFLSVTAVSVSIPDGAYAESFAEKCPEIAACAKAVGELLGQKYVFDPDVKGKTLATPNLELTVENAELIFTNSLHMQGFSRVPLGQANTFQIQREREARDSAIPLVKADKTHPPALPNTWDMVTLQYRLAHPETADAIARLVRSFMPANARIVPSGLGGTLLITDSAANLKKVYDIIQEEDVKPTAELRKTWAEAESRRKATQAE